MGEEMSYYKKEDPLKVTTKLLFNLGTVEFYFYCVLNDEQVEWLPIKINSLSYR